MANTHMLYFTIRQRYDADIRHADIGFCTQSGQPCVQSRATQRHFTQTKYVWKAFEPNFPINPYVRLLVWLVGCLVYWLVGLSQILNHRNSQRS